MLLILQITIGVAFGVLIGLLAYFHPKRVVQLLAAIIFYGFLFLLFVALLALLFFAAHWFGINAATLKEIGAGLLLMIVVGAAIGQIGVSGGAVLVALELIPTALARLRTCVVDLLKGRSRQ